ncbi:MAG: Uma2 family endonuclease [Cyanobacteria bacterium P01_G01_bin.54]
MTLAASKPVSVSLTDYFEQEAIAQTRQEYRAGAVIPMAGGTPNHNQIISNLNALLNVGLRRHPYRTYASDQRLWIPAAAVATYPDLMVVAEPLERHEQREDTLVNALLIAEVLSKSTRNYDKGDKFSAYRNLSQFREYLTLEQSLPYGEHYYKTEQGWLLQEYSGFDAQIELQTIGITLVLADLYDKVDGVEDSVCGGK